jgi:hypothetical protein
MPVWMLLYLAAICCCFSDQLVAVIPGSGADGGPSSQGASAAASSCSATVMDPAVEVRHWDPDVVHQLEAVDGQDNYHRCIQQCGKPLACKHHACDDLCHLGPCAPCSVTSHLPLTCACGAAVVPPPVRCGREPPTCQLPCSVPRPCGHPAGAWHTCHFGECPPCVALTSKYVAVTVVCSCSSVSVHQRAICGYWH